MANRQHRRMAKKLVEKDPKMKQMANSIAKDITDTFMEYLDKAKKESEGTEGPLNFDLEGLQKAIMAKGDTIQEKATGILKEMKKDKEKDLQKANFKNNVIKVNLAGKL